MRRVILGNYEVRTENKERLRQQAETKVEGWEKMEEPAPITRIVSTLEDRRLQGAKVHARYSVMELQNKKASREKPVDGVVCAMRVYVYAYREFGRERKRKKQETSITMVMNVHG